MNFIKIYMLKISKYTVIHEVEDGVLLYNMKNGAQLHILLNITKADYAAIDPDRRIPYLRILGFRSSSKALLRMIKEESECPMITKVADAESILDDYAMQMLDKDVKV